jgi:aryl-alcohol dehydrogenase-like predicted oxidoreductase
VARERGLTRFVAAQNHYSLVEREVEAEILPACERLGIGMLPFFPLASGLLTGKYVRGEEATEGRLAGREIPDERWDRLERLEHFADAHGVPLLSVAIGGLAAMPAVASVIAGATRPEQVRANVAAGAWLPSAEELAALNDRSLV